MGNLTPDVFSNYNICALRHNVRDMIETGNNVTRSNKSFDALEYRFTRLNISEILSKNLSNARNFLKYTISRVTVHVKLERYLQYLNLQI